MMVKLADIEEGAVFADGKGAKTILKERIILRLDEAIGEAKKLWNLQVFLAHILMVCTMEDI